MKILEDLTTKPLALPVLCYNCGKEFIQNPNYKKGQKYCSDKCCHHDHYMKNREKVLLTTMSYYREHREQCLRARKKQPQKLRIEILEKLGNMCVNPYGLHDKPFTDVRCLQIDHVNGHGLKEMKSFHDRKAYYRFILKRIRNGSKDYQLLCANCNWIKRHENQENGKE